MKKFFALILMLTMLAGAALAEKPTGEFAVFGDLGKVDDVQIDDSGAAIEATGFWGYHMDLEPSVSIRAFIGTDGVIQSVSLIGSKDQTEGFADQITDDYLKAAYAGRSPIRS